MAEQDTRLLLWGLILLNIIVLIGIGFVWFHLLEVRARARRQEKRMDMIIEKLKSLWIFATKLPRHE